MVQSEHAESADQVEPPAARWTAPGLRRRRAVEGATRPQPLAPGSAEEGREVAAAIALAEVSRAEPPLPDDTSTLAASLASGVRSMVRPFDRLLGRGGNDDLPAVSPSAPSQSEDGRTRRDRRDENDYMMYGPTLAQPTVGSLEDVHSEPLVAARNRFASNGQPGRAGDDAPRYGSGYGANQPDPIVPFPSESERTGRTPEPAGLSWPPVDKEKPK